MLIYIVPNNVAELYDYVCDSQATIDARPKNEQGQYIIPADQCSVGGQPQADAILANNQQAWLTQQADLFTVDLQTTVEGGVNWTVVDLTTQPPNDDYEYFLLNPITGLYTEAIGLDAAKVVFAQIQQEYLVFTNINVYTVKTTW
jgi:hypothetical protein